MKTSPEEDKKALVRRWNESGQIINEAAIKAFIETPREMFVPDKYLDEAYGDYPLPIPCGQTISQPTTVMVITQALELEKGHRALEVGAGSGYQAAIIANIIGKKGTVYSTELISELALLAERNLKKAGVTNAKVICKDGSKGYPKAAPYDRIVISAACREIPLPLIEQLKNNGIIVAPVGDTSMQKLIKLRKHNSTFNTKSLGDFVFVPLKGEYGSGS